MASNIPWDLFGKLFRNDISAIERQNLNNWRELSELNRNIYDEITEDENIKQVILSGKWDNNALEWEKLLNRIEAPKSRLTLSYNTLYLVASAAAVILLLIGIVSTLFYEKLNKSSDQSGFSYIFSPRGQRTRVVLPDQTKVWLNSESSLRYAVAYNETSREVYLEGEAFFEVEKNPKKPFYVQTGAVKVKVYGTKFNLKAFPNEKYVEATLIEGKLSVTPLDRTQLLGKEIFLKPKEKLIYEKHNNETPLHKSGVSTIADNKNDTTKSSISKNQENAEIILEKNINPEIELMWREGKLVFKNETFADLAIRLERWYDVKIHFESEAIKNYRFTGEFYKETIDEAMQALKISSQHTYTFKIVFRDIYLRTGTK
jgi:transmembrane sensor